MRAAFPLSSKEVSPTKIWTLEALLLKNRLRLVFIDKPYYMHIVPDTVCLIEKPENVWWYQVKNVTLSP